MENTTKQFINLTVKDELYSVRENGYKEPIKRCFITKVERFGTPERLCINFSKDSLHDYLLFGLDSRSLDDYPAPEKTYAAKDGFVYFTSITDAERYRKRHGIRNLLNLIQGAKNAVEAVKAFRKENFDDLNKNWLENEINKLEKQVA